MLQELFFQRLAAQASVGMIDLYLRVLLAIDSEIADVEIHRTKDELDRNTRIKDEMRATCVSQMVESWFIILVKDYCSITI